VGKSSVAGGRSSAGFLGGEARGKGNAGKGRGTQKSGGTVTVDLVGIFVAFTNALKDRMRRGIAEGNVTGRNLRLAGKSAALQ